MRVNIFWNANNNPVACVHRKAVVRCVASKTENPVPCTKLVDVFAHAGDPAHVEVSRPKRVIRGARFRQARIQSLVPGKLRSRTDERRLGFDQNLALR